MARRALRDRADKMRQRCIEIGARRVRYALLQRLAFSVTGRRRDTEVQRGPVNLVGVEQQLRKLGRLAEAYRQQSAGQRVERAGVSGLGGIKQALRLLQGCVRRESYRL